MNVPGFIARQFYVSGSLRNTASGFSLQAHNPLGDGTLVGLGRISVDGQDVPPSSVSAVRDGDGEPIHAASVSRERPILVRRGDRVTLHVEGAPLTIGEHRLEVELHERDMGQLRFSVTDRLEG